MSFLQRSSAPWMNILSLLVVEVEEEPLLEAVLEEGLRDPLLLSPTAAGRGPEDPSGSSILHCSGEGLLSTSSLRRPGWRW